MVPPIVPRFFERLSLRAIGCDGGRSMEIGGRITAGNEDAGGSSVGGGLSCATTGTSTTGATGSGTPSGAGSGCSLSVMGREGGRSIGEATDACGITAEGVDADRCSANTGDGQARSAY